MTSGSPPPPSSPRGRCMSCFTADKSTPSPFNDRTQPLGSIFHLGRTSGCVHVCVYVQRCTKMCLPMTRRPLKRPGLMILPINPEEQGSRYHHPRWISSSTYPCLHLLYPSNHLSRFIYCTGAPPPFFFLFFYNFFPPISF